MTIAEFLADWRSQSPTLLVHTSGSTGKPKPMLVEKQKMLNSARVTCDFLGLRPGDTFILCMPLDYIAGKMVVVRAIERGLRLIGVKPGGHPLADQKEAEYIDFSSAHPVLQHIAPLPSGGWTGAEAVVAMVPLQVYNSLQVPRERERIMSVRHLIIGGGAIDDRMACELKAFPNAVWSTYGMTETLSHIALRRLSGPGADDWYTPFDSVAVGRAADGCLTIDAPLVHDGVLKTNDRVEMRDDPMTGRRQFRVMGRKDNVIDSGGIKIQTEEVERALKPFMAKPFAITKAPDEKFGEIVVLVTEATDLSEVQEVCRNALPKYWQPRRYLHVDKMPMTETGKIARSRLLQASSRSGGC